MAIYFRAKDKKTRAIFQKVELARCKLQFFLRNSSVSINSKQRLSMTHAKVVGKFFSASTRVRNRCVLTHRAGSVFRYFKLSRIMLKELASQGSLTGVRKSSW